MYRGTTPNLYLELETDLDLANAKEIWLTIQSQRSILNKEKEDIEVRTTEDPGVQLLIVSLTQKDTLRLTEGKAEVQVRILMSNGKAYSTDIAYVDVNQILRDGVITDDDT